MYFLIFVISFFSATRTASREIPYLSAICCSVSGFSAISLVFKITLSRSDSVLAKSLNFSSSRLRNSP